MPFHVQTPGALEVGDVYWKGNDSWTKTYADRTQFANKADADAIAATTVTKNGYTYQPSWFKNSTVVTE